MLAAVDPQFWTRHFDHPPGACLALAEHSEFATVFVRGWALAVQRHAQDDPSPALQAWLRDLSVWWIAAAPVLREAVPDSLFDVVATHFARDADGVSSASFAALPDKWSGDAALVRLLARLAAGSPDTCSATLSRHALQQLHAALPILADTGHHGNLRLGQVHLKAGPPRSIWVRYGVLPLPWHSPHNAASLMPTFDQCRGVAN